MLEARMNEARILKGVIEAIRELVSDANFDCSDNGISLQAMDNSHVALVAMNLKADGFDMYRCDRSVSLGVSLGAISKILKCAGNEDQVTLKADESADSLSLLFEDTKKDRVAEYDLKLMDIDAEHLGIPETQYDATIKMSSAEFARICRDLLSLGTESVTIDCSKEGVKFSAEGDTTTGSVTLRQSAAIDDEKDAVPTTIDLQQPVCLGFSLKYLQNFTKATPLSKEVTIALNEEVPLLVEYKVGDVGHIRFYLAPKIGEDE